MSFLAKVISMGRISYNKEVAITFLNHHLEQLFCINEDEFNNNIILLLVS